MRILLLLITLLAFSPVQAEDGWFPYWFPADPAKAPDYMGVPASVFNAGKDVLDAPAGKHGFVKVKEGHFYFEDGTRARFWGTNLCFNACFPRTRKQAEILANRIAYFGFNAVRLHHMDSGFEPNGIFEDVAPAFKDKQMKPTGHLSRRQLDRLDYLIYQLKKRGIYININTLVSRHFTEADRIKDAEALGMAAKPVSLFDLKLIELQKQYAKDLLTHYNPYTKLRYCDDPAVCLVEINNENTLTDCNPSKLPEFYQQELKKLTGDGKITLAELEKKYLTEMRAYLIETVGIKVPIGIGGHWNPAQLTIQRECLDYVDKHGYWDHPKFPNKAWDMNDFRMHNKSMLADKNLGIIGNFKKTYVSVNPSLRGAKSAKASVADKVMKQSAPFVISDAKSAEASVADGATKRSVPFVISEWNHCYPNPYAYETPILLASTARQEDWDALFQFAFSHDWGIKTSFDGIHGYFDANSNAQQLILCSFASRIFLGDVITKNGVRQRYSGGQNLPTHQWRVESANATVADEMTKRSDTPFGSHSASLRAPFTKQSDDVLYRHCEPQGGEAIPPTFEITTDYAEINCAGYSIKVGRIKNTKSGWDSKGKFNWGISPTLLIQK